MLALAWFSCNSAPQELNSIGLWGFGAFRGLGVWGFRAWGLGFRGLGV